MRRAATALVIMAVLHGAASEQDGASSPRRIAPELFHPYAADAANGTAPQALSTMPTKDQPFGSCSRETRDWISCLRATAELSDGMVSQAEERVRAEIDQRPEFGLAMRQILAKALAQANSQWRSLREQECQQLAMLEVRRRVQLYEARLTCQIAHNIERADQLLSRYGNAAPASRP